MEYHKATGLDRQWTNPSSCADTFPFQATAAQQMVHLPWLLSDHCCSSSSQQVEAERRATVTPSAGTPHWSLLSSPSPELLMPSLCLFNKSLNLPNTALMSPFNHSLTTYCHTLFIQSFSFLMTSFLSLCTPASVVQCYNILQVSRAQWSTISPAVWGHQGLLGGRRIRTSGTQREFENQQPTPTAWGRRNRVEVAFSTSLSNGENSSL